MENSEQRRKCGTPTISSPFLKIEGVLIDKSEHNRIWNWSWSNGRNLGCNTYGALKTNLGCQFISIFDVDNNKVYFIYFKTQIKRYSKGIMVSLLILLPSAILTGWKEPISLTPISVMTLVLGSLLGYFIEKFGSDEN